MLGTTLTALIITVALAAGQATAFFNNPRFSSGLNTQTRSGGSGGSKTSFKSTATATCTASSWAQETSASKDGFAKSVELAVADLCTTPWWQTWDYSRATSTIYDYAVAFARAQAQAYVSCESTVSGKATAKACGLSEAYADASADAWAGAFAAALAKASTGCSCATDAVFAYTDASVAVSLFAQAHASAFAAACAEGNQVSAAFASSDCYAVAFAEIVARALAKAFVDAKCWPYGEDAIAVAEAEAAVDITVTEDDVCTFTVGTVGNALTFTDGSGYTSVIQLH